MTLHALVHEPAPDAREVIESTLSSLEWKFETVASRDLLRLRTERPWAFILAWDPLDPSCAELTRTLRTVHPRSGICAILAPHFADARQSALVTGVDEVLLRPITSDDLAGALGRALLARQC
jgi:CheY-like chemotaxis protein